MLEKKYPGGKLWRRWGFQINEGNENFSVLGDSEPLLQEVPSCALPQPYVPKDWGSWFHITPKSISYVQDVVHVAVKLKSWLLRPSITLPMGQYVAAGNHIRMIQLAFGKEQQALRERDVNPRDKQNIDAVLHLLQAAHLLDSWYHWH